MNTLARALYRGKCLNGSGWREFKLGDDVLFDESATPKIGTKWIDPKTVGQWTGLTDKNGGVRIFEGDVISCIGICVGDIHDGKEIIAGLAVPVIAGKDWCAAYKEMLERGCVHA